MMTPTKEDFYLIAKIIKGRHASCVSVVSPGGRERDY